MNWTWLDKMPSQQLLAFVCIVLFIVTGTCAMLNRQVAAWWPGLLEAMLLGTVLKYGIKRWTYKPDGTQETDAP